MTGVASTFRPLPRDRSALQAAMPRRSELDIADDPVHRSDRFVVRGVAARRSG